jgi:hypothetical protein
LYERVQLISLGLFSTILLANPHIFLIFYLPARFYNVIIPATISGNGYNSIVCPQGHHLAYGGWVIYLQVGLGWMLKAA